MGDTDKQEFTSASWTEFHLFSYFRIIEKSKYAIAAIVLASICIALAYNTIATPIYMARGTIIIKRTSEDIKVRAQEIDKPREYNAPNEFNTYVAMLKSMPLLQSMVNNLYEKGYFQDVSSPGATGAMTEDDLKKRLQDVAMGLQSAIRVNPVRLTDMVEINAMHRDKVLARDMVNALADEFVEYNRNEQEMVHQNSLRLLQSQLEESHEKLIESETKLQTYKLEHQIFLDDKDKDLISQKRSGLEVERVNLRGQIEESEARIAELNKLANRTDFMKYVPMLPNYPLLQDLNSDLVNADIDLNKLQLGYGDKHPDVIKARGTIEILKKNFDQEIRKAVAREEFDLKMLRSRHDTLDKSLKEIANDANSTNANDIEYVVLERQVESARQLYQVLLDAVKELSVRVNTLTNDLIFVHEYAKVPGGPIKPEKLMNLIVSLILGLLVGMAWAFAMDFIDQSVKFPEEVEYYTRLNVLACLPRLSPESRSIESLPLILINRPRAIFSEGILGLRANLKIKPPLEKSKAIMVTSSGPEEGKSLIASNLAVAMAKYGLNVLLMDGDLRRPAVHKVFGIQKNQGITQALLSVFYKNVNEYDLSTLCFGDVNLLLNIQRKTGLLRIAKNASGSRVDLLYENGRLIATNLDGFETDRRAADFPGPISRMEFMEGASGFQGLKTDTAERAFKVLGLKDESLDANSLIDTILRDYTQSTSVENLRIMTAGPQLPNPPEILSSDPMRELFRLLRKRFDFIVVDSPPFWPLSDVSILAPMLDGVIYVVRVGRVHRGILQRNIEQLNQLEVDVLGIVLNDLDFRKNRYYYGYYNYNYYYYRRSYGGYGYGYGNKYGYGHSYGYGDEPYYGSEEAHDEDRASMR